jgi:hypothetical protein
LAAGRRVHERYAYRLPIVIVHDGREIHAHTVNLSLGGAFIASETELPYGTQARARFRLPTMKEDTEVPVTVRWKTPEGFGVQFGSLRALEVWALNQLFKSAVQTG